MGTTTERKRNMDSSSVVLIALLSFSPMVLTLAQVTCNETYVLTFGTIGTISCLYDASFLSVRWYKEGTTIPIALIEDGNKLVNNEAYDILGNGNLVLERVMVQHEGIYRISILDKNRRSESRSVYASVIALLVDDPLIHNCSTSDIDMCDIFTDQEKKDVLICETKYTRPPIEFTWSQISPSGPESLHASFQNVSISSDTGLFTSSSTIKVDKNIFAYQYITCKATGDAVKAVHESSIFVKGHKAVDEITSATELVEKGTSFVRRCSDESYQFYSWSFTGNDGTARTLKEAHHTYKGGDCQFLSTCYVDKDGVLRIENISYENEGNYECLYSNGESSAVNVLEMKVKVRPDPEIINIEGCGNTTSCSQSVDVTGVLTASVVGARPAIELTCEVEEDFKAVASIFDGQNSYKENSYSKTFDTVYTANYNIEECSEPVLVVCREVSATPHNSIPSSSAYLEIDNNTCKETGLSPVVIVVIVFVVAAIVAILILVYIKRDRVLSGLCRRRKKSVENIDVNDQSPETVPLQTTIDEPDNSQLDVQEIAANETVSISYENENVKNISHQEFEELYVLAEQKKISGEDFDDKMTEVLKKHGNPTKSLVAFLGSKDLNEKGPWAVLEFIADRIPGFMVSPIDFARELSNLVKENKLPSENFLTIVRNFYIKSKIQISEYVRVTGPLLDSYVSLEDIIKEFRFFAEENVSRLEIADGFLQYFVFNHTKESLPAVYRENKFVPYPYMLQSVYKKIKKIDQDDKWWKWFNEIANSNIQLDEYPEMKVAVDAVHTDKELTLLYIRTLFLSVSTKAIKSETCVELLKGCLEVHGWYWWDYTIKYL